MSSSSIISTSEKKPFRQSVKISLFLCRPQFNLTPARRISHDDGIGNDTGAVAPFETTAEAPLGASSGFDSSAKWRRPTPTPISRERLFLTPSRFVFVLAFSAAVGGFLFGYDTGVVSGAILPLKNEFLLNNVWIQGFKMALCNNAG